MCDDDDNNGFAKAGFFILLTSPAVFLVLLATHWGFSFATDIDMYIFIIGITITVIPAVIMAVVIMGGLAGFYIDKYLKRKENGDRGEQDNNG